MQLFKCPHIRVPFYVFHFAHEFAARNFAARNFTAQRCQVVTFLGTGSSWTYATV